MLPDYIHQEDLSSVGIEHARERIGEMLKDCFGYRYNEFVLPTGKVVFRLEQYQSTAYQP